MAELLSPLQLFDDVVLLAPGGRTVYAGSTGPHALTVTGYFGAHGAPCDPTANPAEHILATVAPVGGQTDVDWPTLWSESEEAREIEREIERVSARTSGGGKVAHGEKAPSPAFAASYREQVKELTIRNVRVSVLLARLLNEVLIHILNRLRLAMDPTGPLSLPLVSFSA